tara:strand:- start:832 stop:1371 length:540 start_codon:yes stop_codon:yes gene_type:complete
MSTALMAKPIGAMMQKQIASRMAERFGEDKDIERQGEITNGSNNGLNIAKRVGSRFTNLPNEIQDRITRESEILKKVNPTNMKDFVLNESQRALTQLQNPLDTINQKFLQSMSTGSGKYSPMREIKQQMPRSVVREGIPTLSNNRFRQFATDQSVVRESEEEDFDLNDIIIQRALRRNN